MSEEEVGRPHYHGHRGRLRARFAHNPENIPDYELLELLLYWVYPRQDVKPKAKALLARHKTLKGVAEQILSGEENNGLYFVFRMVREVARRFLLEEISQGTLLNNAQRVVDYCYLTMAHMPVEQFRLFFLDRKYYLIAEEIQQAGTLDQVPLYPREVLKRALALNAAAIIMVHNHPSGDPTPSKADRELTQFLYSSLLPFNIKVLDHFIIGRHGYISFREQGLLTSS